MGDWLLRIGTGPPAGDDLVRELKRHTGQQWRPIDGAGDLIAVSDTPGESVRIETIDRGRLSVSLGWDRDAASCAIVNPVSSRIMRRSTSSRSMASP